VSTFRSTAPPDGEPPRFYSVAQVAQMLGMSTMTVYRAIRDGEFPAIRVRGRLIVPAKAVEAMGDTAVTARSIAGASGSASVAVTLP
jgi:excisionase family DNA binding protein